MTITPKQTRAALYARVSSSKQREESIEDQFNALEARAAKEGGWDVVAKFADRAVSGSRADRPEYQRMLAAAKRREFDVLLLWKLDRFARDLVEQERTVRRLEFDGLRLVAMDGYDTAQKGGKVHRAIKGAISEDYLEKLAEDTHRGQEGQAKRGYLAGGKAYGYDLVPVMDGTEVDQFGNPKRRGTVLRPNKVQARIVRELFQRFADGESERHIAAVLNGRRIASPGSAWNRKVRRASGWAGSAVNVIVQNSTYTGKLVWNKSRWVKDPDSGIRKRKERPESEWHTHVDDKMRIVDNGIWDRVQKRLALRKTTHVTGGGRGRKAQGPKYVLSGLLRCGLCGAHYIISSKDAYACSSYIGGRSCKNDVRVNRLHAEKVLLAEMRRRLLAPAMVAKMAAELRAEYEKRLQAPAATAPKELQKLDARLSQLRQRLKTGDPALTPDDLQAAIDRAERERLRLLHDTASGRTVRPSAKLYAALPNAAKLYERQIAKGLTGTGVQVERARHLLLQLWGGRVDLRPTPRGLVARSTLHKDVLLTPDKLHGSGGRI